MTEIKLSHAVLFDVNALPIAGGKLINLKDKLNTESVEGKQIGLQLSLMGNFVKITVNGGEGLIPVTAFKMLVPAKEANG